MSGQLRSEGRLTDRFFLDLPVISDFSELIGPARFQPLPDDWVVGITDVVSSTEAIAAGRYRAVNMAGAASVAALMNALESITIPFVFGGDGASFAVHVDQTALAGEALARTCAFVRDEFQMDLRAALVPVRDIRAAGKQVLVARFGPSAHVSYAMFRGGGMSWATDAMKSGQYAVKAAPEGFRPDLSGLSCRFDSGANRRGVMLSLILAPVGEETLAFDALTREIFALASDAAGAGRPFATSDDLALKWQGEAFDLEVMTNHVEGYPRWLVRLERRLYTRFAAFLMRGDRRAGKFDARRYKGEVIANADYRKFDDGLRMTLDCTPAHADMIEAKLQAAEAAGIARYGLHRQAGAIMTCFVPAASDSSHIHFIDGADGGYAAAAKSLKMRAQRATA